MTTTETPAVTDSMDSLRKFAHMLGVDHAKLRTRKQVHEAIIRRASEGWVICPQCRVAHACNECGGPRKSHDEPLCETCTARLLDRQPDPESDHAERLSQVHAAEALKVGGMDDDAVDAIMDEWRNPTDDRIAEPSLLPVRAQPLLPSQAEWTQLEGMAATLYRSNALRAKKLNTEADVVLVLLAARDLGVSATMAIQKIHVIDGKPTLSGELMVALIQRAGYVVTPIEMTTQRAVVQGKRGNETATVEFTWEDAQRAELTGKDNWKHYPKLMLWWRAVSLLARTMFPDVLCGLTYTPDDFDATVDENGDVIDAPGWEVRDSARTSAERPSGMTDDEMRDRARYGDGGEGTPAPLPDDCEQIPRPHDASGLCCKRVIRGRVEALPDDVKQAVITEWREKASQRVLHPSPTLDEGDLPVLRELLDGAEAVAGRMMPTTSTHPQQTVRSPALNDTETAEVAVDRLRSAFDASVVDEAEVVSEHDDDDRETRAARARAIVEEAAAKQEAERRQAREAEKARELAVLANRREREPERCCVCGGDADSTVPGYCVQDEPF